MNPRILGSILLLACALPCRAQGRVARPAPLAGQATAIPARPPLRVFGAADGLPNATVYQTLEDSTGHLWVATQDGTALYGGRGWTSLNLPPESSSRVVRAIAETPDGSRWLGTEHEGLWRLRGGRWTHYGAASELRHDRVNTLKVVQGANGAWALWVGTGGGGAARFQDERWTLLGQTRGLPSSWVWRFVELQEPSGGTSFVAATKGGFARLAGERWEPMLLPPELKGVEVNDIIRLPRPGGGWDLWITAWGRGLYRYDGTRWEAVTPAQGFPSVFPVGFAHTRGPGGQPILWVSTYDAGVAWLWEGRWQRLDAGNGLPANGVYSLMVPRAGRPTLWVGMRDGGLGGLDLSGWYTVDRQMGLPDDEALGFCLDPAARPGDPGVWIATGRGVARWERGAWRVDGTAQGLPHARVHALLAVKDDAGRPRIWAGTRAGLALWSGGRWSRVDLGKEQRDEQIFCMLETRDEDGQRTLWVGTERGLLRLGPGGARLEPFLAEDSVQVLLETCDSGGEKTLWVGTRGGGIACLRQGRWTRIGREQGLPNPAVYTLHEQRGRDGRDWLWAGTFGGGLLRRSLDNPAAPWEVFDTQRLPGLPSDVILGIAADGGGRLHLATQRGVARLCFDDPARPEQPTRALAYASGDGLPSATCLFGAFRGDLQGRIWVGTARGAAFLDPRWEPAPPPLPPLRLDRLRVLERDLDPEPGQEWSFSYRENRIAVAFSLPFYLRERETRFRTQLMPLEAEPGPWEASGAREMTALPAGKYVLRAWARDYLGRETGPVDLVFQVRPAPWRHHGAYVIYGLLLALGLFLLHRLRVKLLHQRAEELEARVHQATAALEDRNAALRRYNEEKVQFMGITAHDIRNPLNTVLLAAQQLTDGQAEPEDVVFFSTRIVKATQQITELVSNLLEVNIIDAGHLRLNLQPMDLAILAQDVAGEFMEGARAKGLELAVEGSGAAPAYADPLHVRNILNNFISNALKFTPAGPPARRIVVRTGWKDGLAFLEVQDPGPGLSDEDKRKAFGRFAKLSARPTGGENSTGLGLSIVRSLAEAMQGHVELETELGRGSTFRVCLPLEPVEPL